MTPRSSPVELRERRREVVDDPSLRGRRLCRALAAVTDDWLAGLFDAVVGDRPGVALVAAGGYGRGELAPRSDLDVWLVHDGRRDIAALAETIWYPVWDSGLTLGHAVRSLREAVALGRDDLDTATAALSSRLLAGDGAVAAELAERSLDAWRRRARHWLAALARGARARGEDGEVAFLLEPDLKAGRGGLRDVQALRWAEAARPVLQRGDAAALSAAEDTLLDVRVELHRGGGRPTEVLLLERQSEVATALGRGDADALMADVAAAARTVTWIGDEVWGRVTSALTGPLGRLARRDRPAGPGLVLREGEVHVLDGGADLAGDGALVLRAAAAAARADARIDRPSLDRLAAEAPVLDGTWPEGARSALVDLLATGRPAVAVVEALDQRGLVERFLPEWAPCRSKPQRNPLHRFTVDRHLLEAAAGAATLASSVARPDLLLVAALLHDLGKGYPGDHTDEGVRLMEAIAPRMGFGPDDVATLTSLVRHHLLLPDVATRRDLADDQVVASVAAAVGSLDVLGLLAALTEADALATGPAAWGSWKAELVAELVERVAGVLRGDEPGERAGDGFPDAEVRRRLAAGRTDLRGDGPHLTVVAPDRPGLFSRVAGVLSLRGLMVVGADAVSADGMAASRFRVEEGTDLDWDAVVADVRRALEGRLALDARLADRARSTRRAAVLTLAGAPHVRVDNAASADCTVVEVRAPDGVAVLYRITRALADLDLDIRLAKVSTLGSEVLDTFYVRTAAGGKVLDRDHQRELQRAVLHRLGA